MYSRGFVTGKVFLQMDKIFYAFSRIVNSLNQSSRACWRGHANYCNCRPILARLCACSAPGTGGQFSLP